MAKFEDTEHGRKYKSPMKAIRANCLDCCNGSPKDVKECDVKNCDLYAYRFGKNPFSKRKMSDKQKEAASKRFKQMWKDKKKEK